MIIANSSFSEMLDSPMRRLYSRVELYEGSTLIDTFARNGKLKSWTIERAGNTSKIFGYGICQKLKVELLDRNRELNLVKGQRLEVAVGVGSDYIYPYPVFFIDEIKRDENNNMLTVTAYDVLNEASKHLVTEVSIYKESYTLETFIVACAAVLGIPVKHENLEGECFCLHYPQGANFVGNETIRAVLDAAAEATQTVYYINNNWELVFKRLDVVKNPVILIDKSKYFTLTSESSIVLNSVTHIDELGVAVQSKDDSIKGITQFIRMNPFWTSFNNVDEMVIDALAAVKGLSVNQFNCSWRGNFLIEIGDKIGMITKDNKVVYSYLLNDAITYNGGLSETTQWKYSESATEQVTTTPATIGEVMKQTYAKVDRVNQEITLFVGETNKQMSELVVRADGVDTTVMNMETMLGSELNTTNSTIEELKSSLNQNVEDINSSLVTLSTQVSAAISSEDIQFEIQTALSNGIESVSTSTGYTFDSEGLTISKTGSEMSTQVTEDGMTVYRGSEGVLIANNEGVHAEDLVATTYLDIGGRSRFENFERSGAQRTGCFWIG